MYFKLIASLIIINLYKYCMHKAFENKLIRKLKGIYNHVLFVQL